MANKKSDPVSFPIHVSTEIERLFDDLIHRPWGFCREIRGWNPSVDLYENGKCFLLEADLPGVKLEDISVTVEDRELVLSGQRTIVQTRAEGRFREMERSSGHFLRRLKLPELVDASQIKAEFCDGVLRVMIPKLKNIKEQLHE
jgi:HSP20 family protein